MAISYTYNISTVPDSITNPTVDASIAKDNTNPYSFLEFITVTRVDYTPEEYNNFYLTYLKEWSTKKNEKKETENITFVEYYVNFLKEIVLVYSTKQEQKFLSTLDFSNPTDLDIAIPFFTNKIREIILFYKERRDETKFVIDRNRIKGTTNSIEKTIFEKIYEYIFSSQQSPSYLALNKSLNDIKNNLNISIEEYVDVYGNYFDIPEFLTSVDRLQTQLDVDGASSALTNEQINELYDFYNNDIPSTSTQRGILYTQDGIKTSANSDSPIVVDNNRLISLNTLTCVSNESTVDDSLRTELYTSNFNTIDVETFFGEDIKNDIFNSTSFLEDLPLIVNVSFNSDPICDIDNPASLFSEEIKCRFGIESTEITDLRKKLIEKYAGVDFYYIDTTSTPTVSGVMFRAAEPWANIPNQQQASTPTVPASETTFIKTQTLLRNVGLFFKPDKIGLFQLDTKTYKYTINEASLVEKKVYIFPDPSIYGNVSTNLQEVSPILFIQDYTNEIANISKGVTQGDPIVSNKEQSFTPYFPREQILQQSISNDDSYKLNFTDLFNKGYISKLQTDIFGNEYALFKDEFGMAFRSIKEKHDDRVVSKLINGHVFYDIDEGYNFNYSTISRDGSTIRSGLSTLTVDLTSTPMFTLSGFPLTLFFRDFLPYQELLNQDRNIIPSFKDGGSFTFLDGTPLPDPVPAGNSNYPTSQTYYYSELACGAVQSLVPLERALQNAGDFTLDVKFILSAASVEKYDCGYFTDNIVLLNDYIYDKKYPYYDFTSPSSKTIISTLSSNNKILTQDERDLLAGKIFVKNQSYSDSLPLSSALSSILNKYSESVKTEIYNNPIDFDIVYDTIAIETNKYLIFDKIVYSDSKFITPNTTNTVFKLLSSAPLIKTSNRFFNEKNKHIIFSIVSPAGFNPVQVGESFGYSEELPQGNDKIIVPNIYRYNIGNNRYKQIFPTVNTTVEEFIDIFSLTNTFSIDYNFSIVKIDKPHLTYNSLNDLYKITFIGVDNNNLFHLFDYQFAIDSEGRVKFSDSLTYQHRKIIRTTDFQTPETLATIKALTDDQFTITNGKLII